MPIGDEYGGMEAVAERVGRTRASVLLVKRLVAEFHPQGKPLRQKSDSRNNTIGRFWPAGFCPELKLGISVSSIVRSIC